MNRKLLVLLVVAMVGVFVVGAVFVFGWSHSSRVSWYKRGGIEIVDGKTQYKLIGPEAGDPTDDELTRLALADNPSFFSAAQLDQQTTLANYPGGPAFQTYLFSNGYESFSSELVAFEVTGSIPRGNFAASPSPSSSPPPTAPPTTPPYTLGPAPTGCPTSAPAPMTSGTATVTMTTNFGTIVIKVDSSLGPNAAGAFVALARCGYYDNVLFHRVVANFVIQTGDGEYGRLPSFTPSQMGQGGPGWNIPDDKVTTTYKRGTLAMARTSAANSANSQFFIVLDDSAQTSLGASTTNNYAIFGSVTSGMDVVDRIAAIPLGGEPGPNGEPPSMPLQPAVITGTTVTVP